MTLLCGAGRALLVVTVVSLSTGCTSRDAAQARPYELEGQILALDAEKQEVLIQHGDIKGFMPGMTMPFKVRDAALLQGKTEGDLVRATLMVGPDEAWLASIDKTGSAPLADRPEMPAAAFVTPLAPGDAVPETPLTDERGQPFSLPQLRGSAVAVTFIYVRCPLPQFCPLLDRRFAEVQRLVASDPALNGRVRLVSVSFDPDADTPELLRAHARKLGADPEVWRFATAPQPIVDRFAARFGVNVIREKDRTITHNMRTVVIAPSGHVTAVREGSEWTAAALTSDLGAALER